MVKKFLLIIIFFYLLILLQTSFLVHFDIFWSGFLTYSFILILIIFLGLFAFKNLWLAIGMTFATGLFLDIFSGSFIGFHILILVLTLVGLKFFLQKYVRIPIIKSI